MSAESRRSRRSRASQRGIAIILVMAGITLMAIMLTEFQDQESGDLASAIYERDSLRAEYAAKSAVNLARLLLASEPTVRKTLLPLFMMMHASPPQIPIWEFSDQVLGAFGDSSGVDKFRGLAQLDMTQAKNLGLEGAGFDVMVIDEDSKLDLNLAAKGDPFSEDRAGAAMLGLIGGEQYNSLFEGRDGDGQFSTRQDVCGAVVDWTDPNTDKYGCDPHAGTAQTYGTEDTYYQMLTDPYPRKNAAFDSLEELRMVRGVTEDFWSTFIDPNPDDPHSRPVTVWGQGATNVNTANAQAILAIVCANALNAPMCTDMEQAASFLQVITLVRSFTQGAPVFSNPQEFISAMQGQGPVGQILAALQVQPVTFLSPADVVKTITTQSKVFSIVATGYVKGPHRETRVKIQAVVDFRGAPAPNAALAALAAATGAGGAANQLAAAAAAAAGGAPSGSANLSTAGAAQQAITGALSADPAGKVLYFRIN